MQRNGGADMTDHISCYYAVCPECNISGGGCCIPPTAKKFQPVDHEKELKKWLADLDFEITHDIAEKERNKERLTN